MPPDQPPRDPRPESLRPADAKALLDSARQLERAAQTTLPGNNPLRGKNLALLCDSESSDEAVLFRRAAEDLGARVAHIDPDWSTPNSSPDLQNTARTLGRLYDAVECQGLPADIVRQLGDAAGVPVYDGIAMPGHPTASLADALGPAGSQAARRQRILQAVLVTTLL